MTVEQSARDLQPSVYKDRTRTKPTSALGLAGENCFVAAVGPIPFEKEYTCAPAWGSHNATVDQDMSPEEILHLFKTSIDREMGRIISHLQQELLALLESFPPRDHSDANAHATLQDILTHWLGNLGLDSTLAQPVVPINNSGTPQVFDSVRPASDFEKSSVAISKLNAAIAQLEELIADLDSIKSSLQASRAQAVAVMETSRRRVIAFVNT